MTGRSVAFPDPGGVTAICICSTKEVFDPEGVAGGTDAFGLTQSTNPSIHRTSSRSSTMLHACGCRLPCCYQFGQVEARFAIQERNVKQGLVRLPLLEFLIDALSAITIIPDPLHSRIRYQPFGAPE